jgi:long-chain acyl-CoA synthetase
VFLSFLPLSHAFERTTGYYLAVAAGSCVAYARSVRDLPEDLLAVRPTVLISVPRVYERVYARVHKGLAEKGAVAQRLFQWAEQIGWQRFEAAQHREPPGAIVRLMGPALRHLVADKILSRLGGRLRLAISGGAPLYGAISHCFVGLRLPLLHGHVFIVGRLKEILVSSTGEKVAPADLEMAITQDPLFGQAMVVGEGKPYLAALLVLNGDAWRALAGELAL